MAAINAPFSSAGRGLQNMLSRSLPVPAFAAASSANIPNVGTLHLNVDGIGSLPVQAPIDVLSELTTALRRKKKLRPNL